MACVSWLDVSPTADENISVVDEVSSDVLCPSVVIDIEDGEVLIEDDVVSVVDPLSPVEDSNVDILVGDTADVNVD